VNILLIHFLYKLWPIQIFDDGKSLISFFMFDFLSWSIRTEEEEKNAFNCCENGRERENYAVGNPNACVFQDQFEDNHKDYTYDFAKTEEKTKHSSKLLRSNFSEIDGRNASIDSYTCALDEPTCYQKRKIVHVDHDDSYDVDDGGHIDADDPSEFFDELDGSKDAYDSSSGHDSDEKRGGSGLRNGDVILIHQSLNGHRCDFLHSVA
jgi:hypothetical protein